MLFVTTGSWRLLVIGWQVRTTNKYMHGVEKVVLEGYGRLNCSLV